MSNLPRAALRQLEKAQELLQAQQAQANKPTDEGATTDENTVQPQGSAQEHPAPTAPAPTVADNATPAPTVDWEHKFKTLKGIFDAEMPRLQGQNKELNQQMQEMKRQLTDLQEQRTATGQGTTKAPPAQPDRDVEDFGADMVGMVQRQTSVVLARSLAETSKVLASLSTRLDNLERNAQGTAQVAQATQQDVFFNRLTQLVPDWEQVNASQAFLDWLAQADALYGMTRQDALNQAQSQGDVQRVAKVFEAFKAMSAPAKSATHVKPLSERVSPKAATAPAPSATPTEKPTITQAQVAAFYHELATGKYRDRPQVAQQLEQMINEALAEGRIK